MKDLSNIRKGMQVYGTDNQAFGTVEDIYDNEILVNGQRIPVSGISRVDQNRIYLTGSYAGNYNQQTGNELRVPVVEERLNVEKRQANIGEVQVQKRVTSEQQSIPVELRHEEVEVQERNIADRPLRPGEVEGAFQEGTIRVPLRGEEAVTNKQAYVTGEAVIRKDVVAEQQQVADTVRREEVYVDDNNASTNYQQGQTRTTANYDTTSGYNTGTSGYDTSGTSGYATGTTGYDTAATSRTSGYDTSSTTGYDTTTRGTNYDTDNYRQSGGDAYATTSRSGGYGTSGNWDLHEGMEVLASDGDRIGTVKSVQGDTIQVDRRGKRDIAVTFGSIQDIQGDQVLLNMPSQALDAF